MSPCKFAQFINFIIQLFDVKTGEPAILSYAVRWMYNRDLETGTFVPPGQIPPKTVPAFAVWVYSGDLFFVVLKLLICSTGPKDMDSWKCALSYEFDISEDRGLIEYMKVRFVLLIWSKINLIIGPRTSRTTCSP